MFVVDFFFFIFLGYYLNNVLPHDFGIRRPWNFLCTLKFWNPKRKKRKERFSEFFTRKDDISLSTSLIDLDTEEEDLRFHGKMKKIKKKKKEKFLK